MIKIIKKIFLRKNKEDEKPKIPLSDKERQTLCKASKYTMTSLERQLALIEAINYIVERNLEGSIVECGVWRGGSSMLIAIELSNKGSTNRDLYLCDTFQGMTEPTDKDQTQDGVYARQHLAEDPNKEGLNWCVASLGDVQNNMKSTGYPSERIHYIEGPVEETIPSQIPDGPIALLRLDTDWYESTKHELEQLFHRVVEGGIIIIDDYGHWRGAQQATDEFLSKQNKRYFLHRIDYTGRLIIKA
jgi:predicted O-methyltransferase YrrM